MTTVCNTRGCNRPAAPSTTKKHHGKKCVECVRTLKSARNLNNLVKRHGQRLALVVGWQEFTVDSEVTKMKTRDFVQSNLEVTTVPVLNSCVQCGGLFLSENGGSKQRVFCHNSSCRDQFYHARYRDAETGPCSVDGCPNQYRYGTADRLCEMHYARVRRHGDPSKRARRGRPSPDTPTFVDAPLDECLRGHDLTDDANIYIDPEGRRKCRVCYRYRRADRRARLAEATPRDIPPSSVAGLEEMYQTCWICGGVSDHMAFDHVKPIAKGGAHIPANLRLACRSCNSSKNARWPFPTSTKAARLDSARLP